MVEVLGQIEDFEIYRDLNKNQELAQNEHLWQCQEDFPGTKLFMKNLEEAIKKLSPDQINGSEAVTLDYELRMDDSCMAEGLKNNSQEAIPDVYWLIVKRNKTKDLVYPITVKGDKAQELSVKNSSQT